MSASPDYVHCLITPWSDCSDNNSHINTLYVAHVKFWETNIIFFSNALSTKIYAQNVLHGTMHKFLELMSSQRKVVIINLAAFVHIGLQRENV